MALQVYSTLTRKKQPFEKKPGETVTMYVCGPTVYKPSHIGHMVGPVIFDTVKRYLTYLGYNVKWVVNITDVDDKLIVRAGELKTTVPELAGRMTEDYYDCLKKLNVTGIDAFPKATEHIPGMISMMQTLIDKGYAYAAGGDVYFDVSKDHDYGKLCNRDPEQLEAGTRAEVSTKKRNPGDFALWKGAKPTEPAEVQFDSPWGKGRPGWHIECSVMAAALLGETLDIHGGGLDLQFPHHENELAQSESATDQPFAKVWMHNGLLKLKNKDGKEDKMAGSLGNVLNMSRALERDVRGRPAVLHAEHPLPLPDRPGIWDWNNPQTPLLDGMVSAKRAYETFTRFADRATRIALRPFADLPIPDAVRRGECQSPALAEFSAGSARRWTTTSTPAGRSASCSSCCHDRNKLADVKRLEDPAVTRDGAGEAEFLRSRRPGQTDPRHPGPVVCRRVGHSRRRFRTDRRPHAIAHRPAEQPAGHGEGDHRQNRPDQENPVRPDRPDPPTAGGPERRPGRPTGGNVLASGVAETG